MGVKGLTTYINQNSHRYLTSHELRDCNLVIDGNNLACQIFKWYGPHNSAYGGDYDKYSESVAAFFHNLKQCNVTVYVIMDGGYERRKLRTVHQRLRRKIAVVAKCTPSPQNDVQVFPPLLKHAFKDILRKLSIPFAQCDFEADDEIAAVARKLGCPVLSYDSDFYIYNVPYIPFSTCEVGVKRRKEGGQDVNFIKCKIYHVEGLVKHFGGLDSSLLPLMAVLLGNDYVKGSMFKKFFLQMKLPSSKNMSPQQKKIAEVIEWLKKETVESALIKILSKFKKQRRAFLSRLFHRSIKVYSEQFSTTLKYLGLEDDTSPSNSTSVIPVIDLNDERIEESGEALDDEECSEASECDDKSGSHSENSECEEQEEEIEVETCTPSEKTKKVFPPWLMDSFRKGLIDASVANIFYLSCCYFDPQVEDFTLSPTYELSLPILKVSVGLLAKSDHVLNDDEEYVLRCYGRNTKGRAQKLELNPVMETNSVKEFCNLSSLNCWPETTRESVLLDSMTLTTDKDVELLKAFPAEWRLYAMAIIYWGRQNKEWPHVTNCHIHALVLGIISLNIVDAKIGYYRNTNAFLKKHGSSIRKAQSQLPENKLKVEMSSDADPITGVGALLESVSFEECLFLEDRLIEYHQGKSCPYSLTAVHSFGQLQSCLSQAITLNALLGFPVPHCAIANFYSGKFVTSVYADLSKRSNLEVYLDLIMKSSPTIRKLHRTIVEIFCKLVPNLLELVRKGKNKRKKKALKRRVRVEADRSDDEVSDKSVDGDEFSCLENRFSVLRVQ